MRNSDLENCPCVVFMALGFRVCCRRLDAKGFVVVDAAVAAKQARGFGAKG